MSDTDWIIPEKPAYVLCNPPEEEQENCHKGLLWGHGDPALAYLKPQNHWAVVKVKAYRDVELRGSRCIEFNDYETIFEGTRADAVNRLVALGGDPARISPEIQVKQNSSIAQTGYYGTSIVATDGIADTGACGYAEAGDRGIARTGEVGYAKAGDGGLAIVEGKRYGTAVAGDGGIAIGAERFKRLSVGNGGIAIAAVGGRLWLGDRSIGISRSGGEVFGGNQCIAIGEVVSGGPGSLLIARELVFDDATDTSEWQFACGIVGRNGIEPGVQYIVKAGELVRREE